MSTNPFAGHELRSPALAEAEAARIVREVWGVEGTASELGSHQDQNFLIHAADGRRVLKIANAVFDRAELEMQNAAMSHVAAASPGFSVQTAIPAGDGALIVRVGEHDVRLVTFIDGEPLDGRRYLAPAVRRALGGLAGGTAAALADFEHPAARRRMQWDVAQAADVVAALAGGVADRGRRELAIRSMDAASVALEPLVGALRRQVIHSDVTVWNAIARPDRAGRPMPCGLIDFGDMVESWLAAEAAVAACGALPGDESCALTVLAQVVAGFNAAHPLADEEFRALPALLYARAAAVAVSTDQQAALEPGNAYATDLVEADWDVLERTAAYPLPVLEAALRGAAGAVVARSAPRPAASMLDHPPRAVVCRWGEADRDPPRVSIAFEAAEPAGTAVHAPVAGEVVPAGERLALVAGDVRIVVRGVDAEAAGAVAAGSVLGRVDAGGRIGVQVLRGVETAPASVPPDEADAWLAVSADPAPLLALDEVAVELDGAAALRQRLAHVAAPQRHYFEAPPQIEQGLGTRLYDTAGRTYLDVVNNVAVLGHSHPAVERAAARQLRLLNTNSRFLYGSLGQFATRLAALCPDPLDQVFVVSTGSEANDLALRIARAATGVDDAICVEGAYHGWTRAVLEVSPSLADNPAGAATRPSWIHVVASPNTYRGVHRGPDGADRYAAEVEEVCRRLAEQGHPPTLIAEAFYGNAGGVALPPGYLGRCYAAVRAAGGVCIADEVQVGYGRLGEHFWAFQQQGVVPDIVTIAKATGNGYPVAAVITTRELVDAFGRSGSFFASVGGSPVACEVGLAVLDTIEREGLQENARVVGAYWKAALGDIVERHPLAGAVHGMGLYMGLELVRDRVTLEPATEEALAICERFRELGIICQPTADHGNVLKLKPPLCFTRDDADLFTATLDRVLTEGW